MENMVILFPVTLLPCKHSVSLLLSKADSSARVLDPSPLAISKIMWMSSLSPDCHLPFLYWILPICTQLCSHTFHPHPPLATSHSLLPITAKLLRKVVSAFSLPIISPTHSNWASIPSQSCSGIMATNDFHVAKFCGYFSVLLLFDPHST